MRKQEATPISAVSCGTCAGPTQARPLRRCRCAPAGPLMSRDAARVFLSAESSASEEVISDVELPQSNMWCPAPCGSVPPQHRRLPGDEHVPQQQGSAVAVVPLCALLEPAAALSTCLAGSMLAAHEKWVLPQEHVRRCVVRAPHLQESCGSHCRRASGCARFTTCL